MKTIVNVDIYFKFENVDIWTVLEYVIQLELLVHRRHTSNFSALNLNLLWPEKTKCL